MKDTFKLCPSLEQVVESHSTAFGEFLERVFRNSSRDLTLSLTGRCRKLCNTFSKFFFDQDDVLKKSISGLHFLAGDFAVPAAGFDSMTEGRDSPSVSSSPPSNPATSSRRKCCYVSR